MTFFAEIISSGKEKIAGAFNKTFATTKGFVDRAVRNSALEGTPEIIETAHQGVQTSTEFLARHVDVELVEAAQGKYLGILDESQPFGTQESLQDDEIDTSFSEENTYECSVLCSRIPIPYSFIVRWYHIANFLTLVLNSLRISRGNGYVKLGWWGQYRKANTKAQDEPMGKRIIKGWLDWLINNGAGQVKGIALAAGDTADTNTQLPDGSYIPNIRLDRRDYTISPIAIGSGTGNAGNAVGAKTNTAGYAVGATQITLSALTSGNIIAGDEIKLTGDDTRYPVKTGTASSTGTITLAWGLKKAIAASATDITVVTKTTADYANLDVAVLDAIQELIPMKYRLNLRCVVGAGIYNHLNKNAVTLLTTAQNSITESNAMSEYSMKLNLAGYPVVLDQTAPDNMILVTRTAQTSSSWAVQMMLAVTGLTSNPLLANSNIIMLRHVKFWRSLMDLAFKSKIVEFSWESVFYGLRHHKAAVLFHPDSLRFLDEASGVYKSNAVQWQLDKYDQAILD